MVNERAGVILREIRELARDQKGKMSVLNPYALYELVFSCVKGRAIGVLPFTKILVIVESEFRIGTRNEWKPFLKRVFLHGIEPEENSAMLARHRTLLWNDDAILSPSRPIVLRDDDAAKRLNQLRADLDEHALAALTRAVELLQTASNETLIELAYASALDRATVGGPNITPEETTHGIVKASLARNLRDFEKLFLERPPTSPLEIPAGARGARVDSLRAANGLTCLKDGTSNLLLCLLALAVLHRRGHPTGQKMQNLLAILSCYYSRARVEASRAQSYLAATYGIRFREVKRPEELPNEEARKVVRDIEIFNKEARDLEVAVTPRLQEMLQALKKAGLAEVRSGTWIPSVATVTLEPAGNAVDLAKHAADVDTLISLLARFKNYRPWPYNSGRGRYRPRSHPRPPVIQGSSPPPAAGREEWF